LVRLARLDLWGDLCRLRDGAIFMKKVRRRVIYLTYEVQHGQYAIRNFNSASNVCAMLRDRAAMSARPLCVMLMGAAFLSAITPVPTFAEFEKTEWNVQDLYKQCMGVQGSLGKIFCLEFVSGIARQAFTNGLALKDIRDPPSLMTMSIPSACPKSFVPNDAMVEAFSEWANQHLENWGANAQTGVMQAMRDTWPCL
jgi:hypothetical protein